VSGLRYVHHSKWNQVKIPLVKLVKRDDGKGDDEADDDDDDDTDYYDDILLSIVSLRQCFISK
jgi:hypothetical protein